jgi:phospholipid transport system substrate-binding protein
MRLLSSLVLGLAVVIGGVAQAQKLSPEALVEQTTEQVLTTLEQNKEKVKGDPQAVANLVRGIVLPHFDFELMSRFVLARNWRTATPEQQQRFVEQFRELLIRTYATSLSQYSGQEVKYLPNPPAPNDKRATVRTEIVQADGPAIPLQYMLREGADGWKVFDVVIDGVSLVQNYRTSFASEVQQRGLEGLIGRLVERNRS